MKFKDIKEFFTRATYSYGIQGMYFKTTIAEVEEIKDDFLGDKVRLTLKDNLGIVDVPIANIKKVSNIDNCKYCYLLKNLLDEEIGHIWRQL